VNDIECKTDVELYAVHHSPAIDLTTSVFSVQTAEFHRQPQTTKPRSSKPRVTSEEQTTIIIINTSHIRSSPSRLQQEKNKNIEYFITAVTCNA